MVLDRQTGRIRHTLFYQLKHLLKKGDVLVVNHARVDRAKLIGQKLTGGKVEIILIGKDKDPFFWRALVRPLLKIGSVIKIAESVQAKLISRNSFGENVLDFNNADPVELMASKGVLPLPPYIKRGEGDEKNKTDLKDYQTVYATKGGSLAAPTAGLHFTQDLLNELKKNGIEIIPVLLKVGWGTFKPVSTSLDAHEMMEEAFEISPENLQALAQAKKEGRRIISVGTTSTRALESLPLNDLESNVKGTTRLFIRPGFAFQWISGLITNFHVPRSTPISLTAAFTGLQKLEKAYEEAIQKKYRFYSYGDAMLIL